jgi:hypothetical protein
MDAKKPTGKSSAAPAGRPAGAKPKPGKPAGKAPAKPTAQPTSFMNWLGRQVGHVKSAVKTDPTKPGSRATGAGPGPAPKAAAGKSPPTASKSPAAGKATPNPAAAGPSRRPPQAGGPAPSVGGATGTAGGMVVYREDKVEEAEMPDRPGVILRRTIIDEVVVEVRVDPEPESPQR